MAGVYHVSGKLALKNKVAPRIFPGSAGVFLQAQSAVVWQNRRFMDKANWPLKCSLKRSNALFSRMDVVKKTRMRLFPAVVAVGVACFLSGGLPALAAG